MPLVKGKCTGRRGYPPELQRKMLDLLEAGDSHVSHLPEATGRPPTQRLCDPHDQPENADRPNEFTERHSTRDDQR